MDECFSDETNVTVFMGNQDLTKEFFDRYRDMYSNNELLIISNDIEYYGYDITHEIDMPVTRASTTKSKTFKSYDPPYLPASTWNFGHCSRSYTLKV